MTSGEINIGDRVRDRMTRIPGVVLVRLSENSVRFAGEGELPREVPDAQLERVHDLA